MEDPICALRECFILLEFFVTVCDLGKKGCLISFIAF